MKKILAAIFLSVLAAPAFASVKPMTVTGTAVEVDSTYFVVDTGHEKLGIIRDGSSVFSGELKTGDKVSVEYTMTAKNVKITEAAKPPAPKAEPKAPEAKAPEVKSEAPASVPAKVEAPKVETLVKEAPKTEHGVIETPKIDAAKEDIKKAVEPAKKEPGKSLMKQILDSEE